MQGRPHLQDPLSRFRDMSQQFFVKKTLHILLLSLLHHFAHFSKIAITHICMLQSG